MKKNTKIILSVIVIIILCTLSVVGYKGTKFLQDKYHYLRDTITEVDNKLDNHITMNNHYDFDYSWINGKYTVSHGFGALGSNKTKGLTNSIDAFEEYYALGQRIFEVDFDVTDDFVTICNHDENFWRQNANISDDIDYTYENFMNSKIYEKYQPLDYKGIIDILNKYEDVYIITDTKHLDKERIYIQFSQFVNYANDINPNVLDRLIPQIYNEDMFNYVMTIHPFKSIVYTLYQTDWTKEEIMEFCVETGIKYVTIYYEYIEQYGFDLLKLWNACGINVAVHTINDLDTATNYLNSGVTAIYTDELLDSQFGE